MSIPPVLIVEPEPVVSAEEAKAQSYALAELSDAQVNVLIAAATGQLDGPFGVMMRCIGEQEWRQPFDQAETTYRLPAFGNVAVTGVFIGSEEVDEAEYAAKQDALGVYVEGPASVTHIEFTAGFDVVPANIKMAIILVAADIHAKVSEQGNLRSFETYQAFTEQYSNPEVMSAATARVVQALLGRYRGLSYA
ncbi:hypothetical protein [Mesorhizobium sp. CAU 1741]|uniref:hypothetical protein n=1 Tax=Mesorhizobium sp. CAU 1741 TaxID=3140366 RepID=UPI00325B8CCD